MNDPTTELESWRCWHCESRNELAEGAPAPGRRRRVLQVTHEPDCPDYVDDDQPAAEYIADGTGVARIAES